MSYIKIFFQLTHQICSQLFNFFRSTYKELKLFAVQFLPTLIYLYLNAVTRGAQDKCCSVETFLISVYNLEIVDDNGQPQCISFRMPFLAQHSIYHEVVKFLLIIILLFIMILNHSYCRQKV